MESLIPTILEKNDLTEAITGEMVREFTVL